jgi:hypothetical protein
MTLGVINKSKIYFHENHDDNVVDAYLHMSKYPKKAKKEFINIYYMKNHDIYTKDIMITYSSKLRKL